MRFLFSKASEPFDDEKEREEIDVSTLEELLEIIIKHDKSIVIRPPDFDDGLEKPRKGQFEIVIYDYYLE